MLGSRLWSGLEGGRFFDFGEGWESSGLSLPVDRWVDIYNVHARRRDEMEEIFADIWRDGYFALSLQSQTKRGAQETDKMMNEKITSVVLVV